MVVFTEIGLRVCLVSPKGMKTRKTQTSSGTPFAFVSRRQTSLFPERGVPCDLRFAQIRDLL